MELFLPELLLLLLGPVQLLPQELPRSAGLAERAASTTLFSSSSTRSILSPTDRISSPAASILASVATMADFLPGCVTLSSVVGHVRSSRARSQNPDYHPTRHAMPTKEKHATPETHDT